ncbi:Succinate dehydrogenase cytochrome B subunit, mitochondrial [Vanrija pseudolonga]|uniref:Succinate dehydrogenase cytochrome B subunit, mitochondrial n=1 Tax=Vanrija pseudolonga TaxID=143232 RepID=A0AAF0Y9R3_9TREE|nr:Succinate dehydrogenase cytochrome B subunit, mitochondrial [Vanrija pseudolonga]
MSFIARPSLLRAVGTAPALRATLLGSRRFISTEKLNELENLKLLNAQRVLRPRSPDLAIYRPQLTWVASAAHRITGVAIGGAFYAAALVYLLHPIYPAIDSAHLIEFVHGLPTLVKGSLKALVAFPLTFHSFNGIRHLLWDVGKGLSIKGVYTSGYAVIAASVLSTLYLAFGL